MSRPVVLAHRGGAGEGPENTRAAFERALRAGADGVETDVHLTGDGVLVVHHDPAIVVAAGEAPVAISSLTSDVVLAADLAWTHGVGFEKETPPTLDEVLDLAGDALVMIEMKRGPDDRALGAAVAARLQRDPHCDRRVAASFSTDALVAVQIGCPRVRRLGLVREPFDLQAQAGQTLWGQGLLRDLVPGEAVDQARTRGRQVWVWTVDATEQVPPLVAAGVAGLITDVPAAVVASILA